MKTHTQHTRFAGLLYLVIIVTGIFAEFGVRSTLLVPGDAAATAAKILSGEALFRAGLASDLVMIAADIALALVLYLWLRPVSEALALLAALFRLAQAAVLGANALTHAAVLLLLGDATHLAAFAPGQAHALVLLLLDAHSYGYLISQVFFGLHCLVLGYLLWQAVAAPRRLGLLLALAGLGYLAESFTVFLSPGYAALAVPGIALAGLAELVFCLWLLLNGVRFRRSRQRQALWHGR